jgi:hypothetical protein
MTKHDEPLDLGQVPCEQSWGSAPDHPDLHRFSICMELQGICPAKNDRYGQAWRGTFKS